MGTRFMCTVEAPIHEKIKQAIVDAQETDTDLVLRRWRNTSRLFRNKVTEAALKIEKESTTGEFKEVQPYMAGCGKITNNILQFWTAGQVIGLIHDVPTCNELLTRIEIEAVEAMDKSRKMYSPAGEGGNKQGYDQLPSKL